MLGVIVLGVVFLYLALWIVVVTVAYRSAKRRGAPPKQAWRAAGLAFLIMYLIPFWDWLPTVVARKYYCATQAGFTVHRTLDQWKQENPGVAATLVPTPTAPMVIEGRMTTYLLNQRFAWEQTGWGVPLLPLSVSEWRIVDRQNGEVLARYRGVGTSCGRLLAGDAWCGWKVWLDSPPCDITGKAEREFDTMRLAAERLGGDR